MTPASADSSIAAHAGLSRSKSWSLWPGASLRWKLWALTKRTVSPGMGLVPYSAQQRAALASRMDEVPEDLVHLAGDFVHVSILAEKVSGSLDEANAYIPWLEQRTRSLVRHPWFMPAAHALAQALAERKTLSGREVRTIIDAAIEAAFPVPRERLGRQNKRGSGRILTG